MLVNDSEKFIPLFVCLLLPKTDTCISVNVSCMYHNNHDIVSVALLFISTSVIDVVVVWNLRNVFTRWRTYGQPQVAPATSRTECLSAACVKKFNVPRCGRGIPMRL